jgi:hypothetical protein
MLMLWIWNNEAEEQKASGRWDDDDVATDAT